MSFNRYAFKWIIKDRIIWKKVEKIKGLAPDVDVITGDMSNGSLK